MVSTTIKPEPMNRYVAMVDILGFKDLVLASRAIDIWRQVTDVLDRGENFFSHSWIEGDGQIHDYRMFTPNIYIFSDTMFLWTPQLSIQNNHINHRAEEEIKYFFMCLCNLLFYGFLHGLPLRAGVAFGECCIDEVRHIIVGKAVVDAHNTEQAQEWVGAALHHSCVGELSPVRNAEIISPYIIEYDNIPRKSQDLNLRYSIDWIAPMFLLSSPHPDLGSIPYLQVVERVEKQLYEYYHKHSGDEKVRKYYENTIDFLKHYRKLYG